MSRNFYVTKNLGQNLCKKYSENPFRLFSLQWSRNASTSETQIPKPQIPKAIRRGPTEILKALSATVNRDVNGPAYKFYDDPYLYAISNNAKRNFALSKESGRKAAQWVRDKHADCFNHQPDDPVIKDYLPKIVVEENMENVDENDLGNAINDCRVSDAINIYRSLQTNKKEVSNESRQSLLELVSYYNCEDGFDPQFPEEISAVTPPRGPSKSTKTWKDAGLAEELFATLKGEGVKPYCAVIRGMCKYKQIDNAWTFYQECLTEGLIPDVDTFNALLQVTPLMNEEHEQRWVHIEEMLQKMVELKVCPNLRTMNAILESMSLMRGWNKTRTLSLQVVAEFKRLGIDPCLTSYYYLLKIFYTQRNPSSPLLASILDELEGQEFVLQDLKDNEFFFTAMEICNRDLRNFELAQKLHSLFLTSGNDKFIGELHKENSYYRNFLSLAVNSLPLDEFMRMYDEFVPHVHSAQRELMEEIVKNIGFYEDLSVLPRIWSDCIVLEIARNERLMEMTLMVINKHKLEEATSEPLKAQLVEIAWDIWDRVQNQNENLRHKVEWSGNMLGDCVSVLARCGETDKCSEILEALNDNPSLALGLIPLPALSIVFDVMVREEMYQSALIVVKYTKECEYPEVSEMVQKLNEVATDKIKGKLKSIFANDE